MGLGDVGVGGWTWTPIAAGLERFSWNKYTIKGIASLLFTWDFLSEVKKSDSEIKKDNMCSGKNLFIYAVSSYFGSLTSHAFTREIWIWISWRVHFFQEMERLHTFLEPDILKLLQCKWSEVSKQFGNSRRLIVWISRGNRLTFHNRSSEIIPTHRSLIIIGKTKKSTTCRWGRSQRGPWELIWGDISLRCCFLIPFIR